MKKWFWIFSAALVAGVLAIYGQTGWFEQLSYDDEGYTVTCRFVKDGLSFANVLESFKDLTWGGIYMPITYISYMAVISLFGPAHGPQHLVSVLFHAINAVLFFAFLLRLSSPDDKKTSTPPFLIPPSSFLICFLAAALWAWHPLRVESVAWIASRKDTLFTLFTLLGLFSWLRGRRLLTYFLMLCGCLSKPTAMVFPVLAFCVEGLANPAALPNVFPFSRFRTSSSSQSHTSTFSHYILKYIPLLFLAAATALLATYSQTHGDGEAGRGLFYSTFSWRLLNAAVSLGIFFYHTVVPVGLQFWYRPIRGGIPLHTTLGLVSLALTTGGFLLALWKCRAHRRTLLMTALWFCAAISPTLGIAGSFGNHAFADRFTYVPLMALSILIVLVAEDWLGQHPKSSVFRFPFAILPYALLLFSFLIVQFSFSYARTYRNNLTAFENVARWDPGHAYAWTNIGSETILRTGDFEKGIAYFRKSIALFPTEEAEGQLVTALISRNNPQDEDEIVRLCMKHADWSTSPKEGVIPFISKEKDKDGFMSEAMGVISTRHQDWPNAVRCFEEALKRDSREDCRMRLAMSYWNMKRYADALPHLKVLAVSPRTDIASKAKELISVIATKESQK